MVSFAGLIYLAAVVFVACWSGFRAALGGCAVLIAYAWLVYHYPISAFGTDHSKAVRAILSTAITYPLFAIIAGTVQHKLRNAAIREYDARAVATSESEQRRIAEAELWASEEMRRLIVDSSVDAMIGATDTGKITLWNPNAERLFGRSREEAIGSQISDMIVPAADELGSNPQLLHFFKTGENPMSRELIELTSMTKTGEKIFLDLYIADHTTEAGCLYILFVRDISDRKRAERAIQEMNSRLEERVAERTKQLESANQELLGFTYSVSHDLRTPLRAIVSNSRILREELADDLNPDALGHLKRLETNALKMAELIENLLQFARMGQIEIRSHRTDLSAMAEEIGEELRAVRDGSLVVQPGMVIDGDSDMIRIVLLNLMDNAWKYVPPFQKPEVEVGITDQGVFFVRDNGIGFDMRYVDKIWKPFERLHRDSEYAGTGIGLANSKRIVNRHGGDIWAESAPGKGTTMYFDFAGKTRHNEVADRQSA